MDQGVIKKDDIGKMLESLSQDYTVYCPARDKTGAVLSKFESNGESCLAYSNFKLSPKGLFFPQCEVLCTLEEGQLKEAPVPDERIAVFGNRPCDARAQALLDKVFDATTSDFRDPNYLQRRRGSLTISLACAQPQDTCFCSSVGGGPADRTGSDILVFDLGETCLLEACSEAGQAVLESCSNLLQAPSDRETKARDGQVAAAEETVPKVEVNGLKEKLEKSFEDPLWDSIPPRCLGCGVCTYLCPTCHCFDVTDETDGESGRRIRTWDSCQYSLFTLHASGHNPRPSKTGRMRQRLLHKFSYTVDNFGETFCVGCGRCVRNCPVNLDLRETVESLMALRG